MVLLGIIVTTWEIKIIYVHANGSLFILSLNFGVVCKETNIKRKVRILSVIFLVVPILLSST